MIHIFLRQGHVPLHVGQRGLCPCCCLGLWENLGAQVSKIANSKQKELGQIFKGAQERKHTYPSETINSLPYTNHTSNQAHHLTPEYHVPQPDTLTHNQKIPEPVPKNQFMLLRASSVRRQHSFIPHRAGVVTASVFFQGYRTGNSS